MTNLSVELARARLQEADEVKKAAVAKLKNRNSGKKEIKNPTAGLGRSERFDQLTQVVQDGKFTVDVAPKGGDENLVPQADFAEKYTDTMATGKTGGMGGSGENQKSPKGIGVTGMTPNQTTNLKQVGNQWGKVAKTEDDGEQKTFTIPQADFAQTYTDQMKHGVAGGTTAEDGSAADPSKRSYGKMDGGPTRAGGKRDAKLGNDVVGTKDKDTQKVDQVTGPTGDHAQPSDAMKWKDKQGAKTETGGAQNIYKETVESGVTVTLNGKSKATFEVVSHNVLRRMAENYAHYGYNVEFTRTPTTWKKDRVFISRLRESIHAKYNFAPNFAKQARKAAMQRFGQLCRTSYNELYEDRQAFVSTMGAAFRKIENLAEDKYLDSLEFFDCMCRCVIEGDENDFEVITQATDKNMAARQVRNQIHENYGFDTKIKHIFVDGEKFTPKKIREYRAKS